MSSAFILPVGDYFAGKMDLSDIYPEGFWLGPPFGLLNNF